jgi:hypothetical protein
LWKSFALSLEAAYRMGHAHQPMKSMAAFPKSFQWVGVCAAALALVAAGCSQAPPGNEYAALAFSPPQPPLFFKGWSALMLTNLSGFSARVAMVPDFPGMKPVSGQLLGQGSRLLFLPDPDKAKSKGTKDAGISFIWDTVHQEGYVLSEVLQAYAPVSASSLRFTNVVAGEKRGVPERMAGYLCTEQTLTVFGKDGLTSIFQVRQALDLQGFPLRMTSPATSAAFTLNVSQVRLAQQPGDLFQPPNSFSKYESVEAMMTELALRQQNLKRPPVPGGIEPGFTGSPGQPQPR